MLTDESLKSGLYLLTGRFYKNFPLLINNFQKLAVLTKINSPYLITKLFELVTLFASWKLKAAHTRKLQIMFLELFMRVASLLQKDSYLHHKMCIGISFQTFFLNEKKYWYLEITVPNIIFCTSHPILLLSEERTKFLIEMLLSSQCFESWL